MSYFYHRLVRDHHISMYHAILGQLLLKENLPLFWPGREEITRLDDGLSVNEKSDPSPGGEMPQTAEYMVHQNNAISGVLEKGGESLADEGVMSPSAVSPVEFNDEAPVNTGYRHKPTTEERFLAPTARSCPPCNPRRIWSYILYGLLHSEAVEVV